MEARGVHAVGHHDRPARLGERELLAALLVERDQMRMASHEARQRPAQGAAHAAVEHDAIGVVRESGHQLARGRELEHHRPPREAGGEP
jgi:hypothetical protein